jgi:hypothetical protein
MSCACSFPDLPHHSDLSHATSHSSAMLSVNAVKSAILQTVICSDFLKQNLHTFNVPITYYIEIG